MDRYLAQLRSKVKRSIVVNFKILNYDILNSDGYDVSHKRYLYSIYGGIEFDKGLQEGTKKTKVNFFEYENFHECKKAYDQIFSLN